MSVFRIVVGTITLLINVTSGQNVCKEDYRKGLILTNTSVFRSQQHNTLSSCLRSCIATASCEAFTYNLHDLTCSYGGIVSEFEPTADLEYVSSPSQWQAANNENLILPCIHSTCQLGSECHVLKSGSTICIRTECTDDPAIVGFTSMSKERTVGRTVDIICNNGSSSQQRTCLGNGLWTDVNYTCSECFFHHTTYSRARDYCASIGKRLLQYEHANQKLSNLPKGRCQTCPDDLVADEQIRYLKPVCDPDTGYYRYYMFCTCRFTTAVPGMKIKLTMTSPKYYLEIFDGENETFPMVDYSSVTDNVVTNGSEAFVIFRRVLISTALSYSMVPLSTRSSGTVSLSPPVMRLLLWIDSDTDASSFLCYDYVNDRFIEYYSIDYCHTYCETP